MGLLLSNLQTLTSSPIRANSFTNWRLHWLIYRWYPPNRRQSPALSDTDPSTELHTTVAYPSITYLLSWTLSSQHQLTQCLHVTNDTTRQLRQELKSAPLDHRALQLTALQLQKWFTLLHIKLHCGTLLLTRILFLPSLPVQLTNVQRFAIKPLVTQKMVLLPQRAVLSRNHSATIQSKPLQLFPPAPIFYQHIIRKTTFWPLYGTYDHG